LASPCALSRASSIAASTWAWDGEIRGVARGVGSPPRVLADARKFRTLPKVKRGVAQLSQPRWAPGRIRRGRRSVFRRIDLPRSSSSSRARLREP
jgi:hypothetical protein